jgi:hypothetical protein
MLVARLSAIRPGQPVNFVRVELPEKIPWCFFGALGSRHFFISPATGSILMVDYTDTHFEVSVVNRSSGSDGRGLLPLFEGRVACLSAWSDGTNLFALSATTGRQMSLGVPSDDADGADADDVPPDVPPRLWTLSRVATANLEFTDMFGNQDCSRLMRHERWTLVNTQPRKIVLIRSTDEQQLIVGVQIHIKSGSTLHRPPWIKVNEHRVQVTSSRSFGVGLTPAEVGPGVAVLVELGSNGYDIVLDGVDVFVIRGAGRPALDWFWEGQSAFDFGDREEARGGPLLRLCDRLSRAIVEGKSRMEDMTCRKIVRMMYTNPGFSAPCRRVLAKCREGMADVWADEILKMVAAKDVKPQCWGSLWRDLALLPKEATKAIIKEVWGAAPEFAGPFPVVTAFFSD